MKRLHLHIRTDKLAESVKFYSVMFGQQPDKLEPDYAKWLLDDPLANISLSARHGVADGVGIDHAGISLETRDDLDAVANRLKAAGAALAEEAETTCCYAQSNKFWVEDPQGARWELFQTFGESDEYGARPDREAMNAP